MKQTRFAERHPYLFSFSLLLLFFLAGAVAVVASSVTGIAPAAFTIYSLMLLVAAVLIVVTRLRWWSEIGFRPAVSSRQLLIYAPALALVIGNLIANIWIGVTATTVSALANILLLGLLSGFAEETVFRGLMLRAFKPRGAWTAVLVTTAFFGFSHMLNLLGGISSPLYVAVQIAYALAIGFCFAAMAVKGGLVWPLIICHGLGNFAALLSAGTPGGQEVTSMMLILSGIYIVFFGVWGVILMKREQPERSLAY